MSALFEALACEQAQTRPALDANWRREIMSKMRNDLAASWNAELACNGNPILCLYFAIYNDPSQVASGEYANLKPILDRVSANLGAALNAPKPLVERTIISAVRGGGEI